MKTVKLIASIGLAAGAGLLTGVLTAPRKGKHTRSRIVDDLEARKDNVEANTAKRLRKAKRLVDQALEAQKSNGQVAFSKLKEVVKL